MIRTVLALTLVALVAPAFGNGVITEFPGTGLIFKEAADIAIAREDLFVGPDKVTVHYDYRSDASATQTATIGFPMPAVPLNGDPDDPAMWPELEGKDVRNYMQFSASVNGVPVATTLHQFAWHEGKDITAELVAAGIPAYLPYDQTEAAFAAIDPKIVDDFAERGIIHRDDEKTYIIANWLYQTVYEWQQEFEPGLTQVDIAYAPLAGYPSDFGDTYETKGGRYCIDETILNTIADYREKSVGYEVTTVGYITTTATYWKGPIGEFNLTIGKDLSLDKESGQVGTATSFCGRADFTETDTGFTWTAKDYVPQQDIRVVHYFFYSYG